MKKSFKIIGVVILILLTFNSLSYGFSLYNKIVKKDNKVNNFLEKIYMVTIKDRNDDTIKPGQVTKPSDNNSSTESRNKINKFSDELLNEYVNEIMMLPQKEKISIIDALKTITKIKRIYSNVQLGPKTITEIRELAVLSSTNYGNSGAGSIGISKARLNDKSVTLITLGGIKFKKGALTELKEEMLSGVDALNDYLVDVLNIFEAKDENNNLLIPKDKPIIVSGSTIGGMIAQQLLAQEKIVNEYNIEQIICFGSPIIAPCYRNDKTRVVRFTDENDVVPYLGKNVIIKEIAQQLPEIVNPEEYIKKLDDKERIVEDTRTKNILNANLISYADSRKWKKYDPIGMTGKKNKITLEEKMKFYTAPTIDKNNLNK